MDGLFTIEAMRLISPVHLKGSHKKTRGDEKERGNLAVSSDKPGA